MTNPGEVSNVRIESVALFSIFEQYQRRSEASATRLIGAVLGTVSPVDGGSHYVADVKHCFPIPHSEVGAQISINSEYYRLRMQLHRKCYGRDSVLLGWYSMREESNSKEASDLEIHGSPFIREFFARETGSAGAPVAFHLAVTVGGETPTISYSVYKCQSITARTANVDLSNVTPRLLTCEISYGAPELGALNSIATSWVHAIEKDGPQVSVVPLPTHNSSFLLMKAEFESQIKLLKSALGSDATNLKMKEEIKIILSSLGISLSDEENVYPNLDAQLLAKSRVILSEALSALEKGVQEIEDTILSPPVLFSQ